MGAGYSRKDIKEENMREMDLYRGSCMTEQQIQKYRDHVGKQMHLFGYTSCSTSKNLAITFANDEEQNQKKAVLYHIKWYMCNAALHCFVMDSTVSAFCDEQEVLLYDGVYMKVNSVGEEFSGGKQLIVIHLTAG
jgi:hypothetical protein